MPPKRRLAHLKEARHVNDSAKKKKHKSKSKSKAVVRVILYYTKSMQYSQYYSITLVIISTVLSTYKYYYILQYSVTLFNL